jgi:hypothetical protein
VALHENRCTIIYNHVNKHNIMLSSNNSTDNMIHFPIAQTASTVETCPNPVSAPLEVADTEEVATEQPNDEVLPPLSPVTT